MKRRLSFPLKILGGLILVGLIAEFALRWLFGFGQVPLYYASPHYEYALAPDQDLTRFGKRFIVNEAGMRSNPLGEGEFRILKFGDSVLNGGVRIDHDSLCSTQLETRLQAHNPRVRTLNVSAGSWGPDNAFAWMETHGDFDADALVLIFSSHDWTDTMTFQDVVGRVPFYPGEQPRTALGDAATWVYSRYFQEVDWESLPIMEHSPRDPEHATGWLGFYRHAQNRDIPILVYHHTTQKELEAGKWNTRGEALETFLKNHNIFTVTGFAAGYAENDYLDNIHLSASGHRKLADLLYNPVKSVLDEESPNP